MSGICGIVDFDGAPVELGVLQKTAETASHRGPNRIRYWRRDYASLANLALSINSESLREQQPLVDRRGELVLTADARVDNRDELMRTLTGKGCIQYKSPICADLTLAAYQCWGEVPAPFWSA